MSNLTEMKTEQGREQTQSLKQRPRQINSMKQFRVGIFSHTATRDYGGSQIAIDHAVSAARWKQREMTSCIERQSRSSTLRLTFSKSWNSYESTCLQVISYWNRASDTLSTSSMSTSWKQKSQLRSQSRTQKLQKQSWWSQMLARRVRNRNTWKTCSLDRRKCTM